MANTDVSTSLLSHLRKRNPRLRYRNGVEPTTEPDKVKSSTKNPSYISPSLIREWKEFNFSALEIMYNGRLQQILRKQAELRTTMPSSCEEKEIWHETSFEWRILAKWNQEMVQEALTQSSRDLGLGSVYMERGWAADSLKGLIPDWAGMQASHSWTILPGDSKYHLSFSSAHLKKECPRGIVKNTHTGKSWFQPWKQIFTYCVRGLCRYGYIITDRELCVIRVSVLADHPPGPQSSQQLDSQRTDFSDMDPNDKQLIEEVEKHGLVQYKSIPWDASSETENAEKAITVNLALWWLHILAAVNGRLGRDYRPLSEECISEDEKDAGLEVEVDVSEPVNTHRSARKAQENASFVSTLGIPGLTVSSSPTEPEFTAKSGKKREREKANEGAPKLKKKRGKKVAACNDPC
jgi:hypothetical protein